MRDVIEMRIMAVLRRNSSYVAKKSHHLVEYKSLFLFLIALGYVRSGHRRRQGRNKI